MATTPMYLPSFYLMSLHVMRFPQTFPLIFDTVSNQILEAGLGTKIDLYSYTLNSEVTC